MNEYSVLATLLSDGKDFCGYGSHIVSLATSDFARMDSALANFRRGEAPWQERESGTLASDADEVEPDS